METLSAGGKRFIASAGDRSLMQIANALRPALPAYAGKLPRFEMPDWLVRVYGLFDADVRDNAASLGRHKTADTSQGEALLGHPFIAPADAALATARSLIEHKLI